MLVDAVASAAIEDVAHCLLAPPPDDAALAGLRDVLSDMEVSPSQLQNQWFWAHLWKLGGAR